MTDNFPVDDRSLSPASSLSSELYTSEAATQRSSLKAKLTEWLKPIEDQEELRQSIVEAMELLKSILQSIPVAPPYGRLNAHPSLVADIYWTRGPSDDLENEEPEEESGHSIAPYLVAVPGEDHFTLPFQVSDPHAESSRNYYLRHWTVFPSQLANVPCKHMTPDRLRVWINTIFETNFTLTSEVVACLLEFIEDGCDLGQVYGYLRPWIPNVKHEHEFTRLPAALRERRQKDYELRSAAMNSNHIANPRIPPRRVWDLYANRVLPYYALKPHAWSEDYLPDNLWAVSHSWVAPSERHYILTTINGKAWRVPIPRGTTLDSIRNELLMLGAEYVFLDVLCLRQEDKHLSEFESTRKKEWRLDVPTIGYIYTANNQRPVIVYFNGLGLPFRDGLVSRQDRFHWFNRMWTLQETPIIIIPGGLDRKIELNLLDFDPERRHGLWSSWASRQFLQRLKDEVPRLSTLGEAVKKIGLRFYSNPVDEVACLAYLLGCTTLPIYDADMDVEVAWSLLVECLPAKTRTQLLFTEFGSAQRTSLSWWRPKWEEVRACTCFITLPHWYIGKNVELRHEDGFSPRLGYRHGFDAYYHKAYIIEGCCFSPPKS